jgi:hypothetical protein
MDTYNSLPLFILQIVKLTMFIKYACIKIVMDGWDSMTNDQKTMFFRKLFLEPKFLKFIIYHAHFTKIGLAILYVDFNQ